MPARRSLLRWSLGAAGLTALGGVAGLAALGRRRGQDDALAIGVRSAPIASFTRERSDERRFGELTFRSGLVLTSDVAAFGGLSALWRDPNGRGLVAVSDHGQWLTAEVETRDGILAGLGSAVLAPILDQDGGPLRRTPAYDTEGLAIADGIAFVGIERVHEVRRFAWAQDGVRARGVPLAMPAETRDLPANGSFEAVAVAPPGHALAGAVVAIAEEARRGPDAPTRGWVLTGPERFAFDVARSEDFDITDAAFLPSGELLLLERRYTPVSGAACRMRRLPPDALRPGATLDGRIVFEADRRYEIDNMEGLALHRDTATGDMIVTLVSDDNFSPVQRTLLLEFTIVP